MTHEQAEQLALELMREHGVLADGWGFGWSRGKRQLGCAQVRRQRDRGTGKIVETKTIKLSRHLVALNSDDEVRDTILHEIAHALAGVDQGHNQTWKAICRRIGARPVRLADEKTVRSARPRYIVHCRCCESDLGPRYRRIAPERLARMYCRKCGPRSKGKIVVRPVGAESGRL